MDYCTNVFDQKLIRVIKNTYIWSESFQIVPTHPCGCAEVFQSSQSPCRERVSCWGPCVPGVQSSQSWRQGETDQTLRVGPPDSGRASRPVMGGGGRGEGRGEGGGEGGGEGD